MRYLLLFTILVCSINLNAQKAPPWVDYTYRAANYPENLYLVGLATEINIEKYQASTTYDRLNQASRNQIIEQIHVSIKAETEMNISIINTQTDEMLEQSSQSASKAELVGLSFDNYYSKKQKTAYSFSYVLIQDIIDYYNDILNTNTDIIIKNFSGLENSSNKNIALKLLYDVQLKLREIDQATVILVAMKQTASVDFGKITGMKKEVAEYTNNILSSAPLSIGNIASYFSYSLIAQTEEGSTAIICKGKLSYQDSGAESEFSQTLLMSSLNNIGSESTLAIASANSSCNYKISGRYQDSDNDIIVSINLLDIKTGKLVASKERTISKAVLSLDGLKILPINFERIADIPNIELDGNDEEIIIKTDEFIDNPITLSISLNGSSQSDLPILFSFNRDGNLAFSASVNSDKEGKAQYFLNKENIPKSGEYELHTLVDVATLLALDAKSDFYQDIQRDHPPQVRKFKLKVISPTVLVNSKELNLGTEMDIQLLAPAIKNALLELDYKFVDSEEKADYILNINAKTRSGQKNQYMHLTYLDATIAMYKKGTGKEIYKNGLSSVKGGAADYELAGVKAYEKAIQDFLEDFLSELGQK